MYLSDVRGYLLLPDVCIYTLRKSELPSLCTDTVFCTLCGDAVFFGTRAPLPHRAPLCKMHRCAIYGMGFCGAKGLTPDFARFCVQNDLSPRLIALSDMGLSFCLPARECDGLFDKLEKSFPI